MNEGSWISYILPGIGAAFVVFWLVSGLRRRRLPQARQGNRNGFDATGVTDGKRGTSFFATMFAGSQVDGADGGFDASGGDGGGD